MTLQLGTISEGLVDSWNFANPGSLLTCGDHIVEVNGISGDSQKMLKECTRRCVLNMIIQRGRPEQEARQETSVEASAEPAAAVGSLWQRAPWRFCQRPWCCRPSHKSESVADSDLLLRPPAHNVHRCRMCKSTLFRS